MPTTYQHQVHKGVHFNIPPVKLRGSTIPAQVNLDSDISCVGRDEGQRGEDAGGATCTAIAAAGSSVGATVTGRAGAAAAGAAAARAAAAGAATAGAATAGAAAATWWWGLSGIAARCAVGAKRRRGGGRRGRGSGRSRGFGGWWWGGGTGRGRGVGRVGVDGRR